MARKKQVSRSKGSLAKNVITNSKAAKSHKWSLGTTAPSIGVKKKAIPAVMKKSIKKSTRSTGPKKH